MVKTTLVAAFMRANPPHLGHVELIKHVEQIAKEVDGEPAIFLSHTQDKNNPIPYFTKVELLNKWFPGVFIFDDACEVTQPGNILHFATNNGFNKVIIVCGNDRFEKYQRLVEFSKSRPYFKFHSVEIVFHDRNNDGIMMSGTTMRGFVRDNDIESFFNFLPKESKIDNDHVTLWNLCRNWELL